MPSTNQEYKPGTTVKSIIREQEQMDQFVNLVQQRWALTFCTGRMTGTRADFYP